MIARLRALRFMASALRIDREAPPQTVSDRAWLAIAGLANEHLLSPALQAALARRHWPGVPADVREYLTMLGALNRDRNARLRAQAVEAIAALNAAGIRPMLLKGAIALFCDLYPDIGSRMIGDLDLMVPRAQAADAVAILERLGYRLETAYNPVQHAVGEYVRDNEPGAIDLHVELIDSSYLMPAEDVWRRASIVELDGIAFVLASPADLVLHNLLHTQIHHGANFYRGAVELRQLYEFAMLVRRYGTVIDWTALAQHMRAHRLEVLLQSYAWLSQRLFGIGWPHRATPPRAARRHAARSWLALAWPWLPALAGPWANLRFAFAGHRMRDLYPQGRSQVMRRLHHAAQFLRKCGAREIVWRLFRPQ